ncbi:DUF4280 domain-containing protein [Chitinophaga qingshengii]|uniref:DUF4280 domain-containing protein n=1 Tax=Chitinophaga qingshengii TaxID=1569794 RepID=A0ABR7TID3_9BACT|nr:DUF4280 domain-containing protein [Chitinophaga qingshengii]MBC9930272.1 DUF4280 domain-containing protein [Chitinophaga qingshengii]
MADKHFVVQGAVCRCKYGSTVDKLKVIANDKDYINDNAGNSKAIASTKDIGKPFEAGTFGSCSISRSACTPGVTAWKDFYQKVTLTNGGKILTEESTAACATGGDSAISIEYHGQEAAVSQAHFDKVEVESLSVLNPMAAKPDSKKEKPQVKQIKVKADKRIPPELQSAADKSAPVPVLRVRPNESLKFEVVSYYNAAKADKDKVGWKVTGNGGTQVFEETGPSFSLNFDEIGSYRVIAFGKTGPDVQDDTRCAIDVSVVNNSLKEEFEIGAGMGRIIPAIPGKNAKPEQYRVRRGVPVTIGAKYDIAPATEEEKKRVSMRVTDAAGNLIAGPTEPGTDTITFTPANSAATYKVTAMMLPGDTEGTSQEVSKDLISEANSVVSVANTEGTHIIRPGTSMSFNVSKMSYASPAKDFENDAIKWQLNGKLVGTGSQLKLDGHIHFMTPGKYVVEAYVSHADAWDAKKGKPSANAARSEDDWCFEVKQNEITGLRVKDGDTQWVVGKQYTLIADLLMPYKPELDGPVTWVPAGGGGATREHVFAPAKGKFVVSATMRGSSKKLDINADLAEITRWCFTDADNKYKPKAGWNETLKAVIVSPKATGETVNLHALEYDGDDDINYIKDLGNVTFDAKGEARLDVKTNDLKEKLSALWFQGDYYRVFFGVLQKPTGVQFQGTKTVNSEGKKFWFPAKASHLTENEKGNFIYISKKPEIVSVSFFDSTDYPAYKVYPYGEKIKIHIQTKNLAGEELIFQLWENKYKAEDKCVQHSKFKVLANETLPINLDTSKLKTGVAAQDNALRNFYVVLKYEKTKDDKTLVNYMYPEKIADANAYNPADINFYHHIKLSAAQADKLNNATRPVAPAVLGEPMDRAVTECMCQKYDLVWGAKVSCAFRKRVVQMAAKLGLPTKDNEGANWLMTVMALESSRSFSPECGTFKDHKDDSRQGYVGLVQIGKAAALDLGVKRSELMKLTAEQQLEWVEKFLTKNKAKYKSKTDLYLAINYPAACGHGDEPNYVVYDSSNPAYDDNKMFKREKDEYYFDEKGRKKYYSGKKGSSKVWEFEEAINEIYEEGKSHKASDFSCQQKPGVFDAKEIVTYHIYADGRLERQVPKEVKEEYKKKYKYVYHDKNSKEHILGIFNFKTINNNYGATYGGKTVDLIDIRELKDYANGDVKFKLTLNTVRYFVNDKTLGSLLGALLECGYEDYTFNGFSHANGSSSPSKSHKNGYNGDLRYLRKDKAIDKIDLFSASETAGWKAMDVDRQKKFNDALYKFGWKSMLSQTYNGNQLLNHCQNDADNDHNDHLHIQHYSPNYKEVKE